MNDTQILNRVLSDLKLVMERQLPLAPSVTHTMIGNIERWRSERRKPLSGAAEDADTTLVAVDANLADAARAAGYEVKVVREHDDWMEMDIRKPSAAPGPGVVNGRDHIMDCSGIDDWWSKGRVPVVAQSRYAHPWPRPEPFQHYWRCNHHPVALDNFFSSMTQCEHGCDNDAYYYANSKP